MNTKLALVFCLCLSFPGLIQANPITYSTGGVTQQFPSPTTPPTNAPWGPNGYPGDTVELESYTGSLDLTPGAQTLKINTLLWNIDYTYGGTDTDPYAWNDIHFNFNLVQDMTIDGVSGTISQPGSLDAAWDNDYLALIAGPTVSFMLTGYKVDVTPLGVSRTAGSNFSGNNPWIQPSQTIYAEFSVSPASDPVPEPATIVTMSAGIILLIPYFYCKRGRRGSQKQLNRCDPVCATNKISFVAIRLGRCLKTIINRKDTSRARWEVTNRWKQIMAASLMS
jgi:hypothetical protein